MTTPNILPLIQRQGSTGLNIQAVMVAMGISNKTARRLLVNLKAAGSITSVRTGNAVAYIATEHYAPKPAALRLQKPKQKTKRQTSQPRHDIAKVSSITGRSANLSPSRIAIEKILAEATGPLQRGFIADKVGISGDKCKSLLQRIARDNRATCTSTGWVRTTPKAPSQTAAVQRVCNGSQPNGDTDYWRQHMQAHRAPARAGAGDAFGLPSRGISA